MPIISDINKFVLESKKGGQWFVCNLMQGECKKGQLDYEIVEIHYSEDKAKERLVELFMFSQNQKKLIVVKNKNKGNTRASLRVPKKERKRVTLSDIL